MTQKERMLAGLPYKAWMDGLIEEREENAVRLYEYNFLPPERWPEKDKLIKNILGKTGNTVVINAREVFGLTTRNRINKGFPGHTPLFLCPEIRAVRHRMAA